MTPPRDAFEMAAQCWCTPTTQDKVMDVELCTVFAAALKSYGKAEYDRAISDALLKTTPKAIGYKGKLSDVYTALQCVYDQIRNLSKEA